MYRRKSINGSFEWLVVPRYGCNDGTPFIDNILVPIPRWKVGGTVEPWDWGSQYCSRYGTVDVVRLTYLGVRKMCASLRAASVKISFGCTIWRPPKVSDSRQILQDQLVNRTDCGWDNIWDELALQ